VIKQAGSGAQLSRHDCNAHYRLLNAQALADLINATQPDVVETFKEWPSQQRRRYLATRSGISYKEDEFCFARKFDAERRGGFAGAALALGAYLQRNEFKRRTGETDLLLQRTPASPHPELLTVALRRGRQEDAEIHRKSKRPDSKARSSRARVAATLHGPVLLAGDFNLPRSTARSTAIISTDIRRICH